MDAQDIFSRANALGDPPGAKASVTEQFLYDYKLSQIVLEGVFTLVSTGEGDPAEVRTILSGVRSGLNGWQEKTVPPAHLDDFLNVHAQITALGALVSSRLQQKNKHHAQ